MEEGGVEGKGERESSARGESGSSVAEAGEGRLEEVRRMLTGSSM